MAGAWITLLGALITIVFNYIAIPHFGYMASAWATLLCYSTMMIVSYHWGQRVYYIPYATKKLIAYFVICLLLYGIHLIVQYFTDIVSTRISIGTIELILFIWFVSRVERKELSSLFKKQS